MSIVYINSFVFFAEALVAAVLDLQFADTKSLTDQASGNELITFSRASSGTYVGSDGLIKTSLVNKLLYSNEFTNGAWTKGNLSFISSSTTAPDGTATATTFSAPNTAFIFQDTSSVIGESYVNSIWIKGNANATIGLRKPGTTNTEIGDGSKSINITTEWQRFTAVTTSADDLDGRLLIDFRAGNGASVPAGFEVSLWHAQTEEGATANDYIPTGATISGAPRFDHDPVTGASLGLLIEESRTNLIQYSQDLITNWWTKTNTVSSVESAPNPFGNPTVNKIRASGSAIDHYIYRNNTNTVSANTDHTFSVLAAPEGTGNDSGKIQLRVFSIGHTSAIVNFDLNTGQYNAQDGTSGTSVNGVTWSISDYGMEPYANGWYRVWMSFQVSNVASIGFVSIDDINASDAGGIYSYAASNTGGCLVTGIQLEAGSFPTSYIPTSGSTVTRSADIASIEGTNFSGFYNQNAGTLLVDYQAYSASGAQQIAGFTQGTNSSFRWGIWNNQLYMDNAGTQYLASLTSSSARTKAAFAVTSNDGIGALNGTLTAQDTALTMPTVDNLHIGRTAGGLDGFNGHIKSLSYYGTRPADTDLETLTNP